MRLPITLLLLSVPAALPAGTDVSFPGSAICALCHSRIPPPADGQADSVAPHALWRGSLMAHSSHDPFWKAKVQEGAALTASGIPAGVASSLYQIALPAGAPPARIRVEALHQSIDPAYVPAAEFGSLASAMAPATMASVELSLTAAK